MSKFKIGQKVKVKSHKELIELGYSKDFPTIFDFADTIGTISSIDENISDEIQYYHLDTVKTIIFIDADLELI